MNHGIPLSEAAAMQMRRRGQRRAALGGPQAGAARSGPQDRVPVDGGRQARIKEAPAAWLPVYVG